MLISSYIMKHIIINNNKILYKLFHTLFALYNKKRWKNICAMLLRSGSRAGLLPRHGCWVRIALGLRILCRSQHLVRPYFTDCKGWWGRKFVVVRHCSRILAGWFWNAVRACSLIPIPCGLKCIDMDWDEFWLIMDLNRLNTTQSTWIES
jgi:hypothetical protein